GQRRRGVTTDRGVVSYPFTPKSNRFLRPGQFWAVPLSNGRYAAGRVMAVPAFGRASRTGFVAGLMDWHGDAPPTADDLAGRQVLEQAETFFHAISRTGGAVLGERDLALESLSAMNPHGKTVRVWGWA